MGKGMLEPPSSIQQVEQLIRLVKKGDAASLTQLRLRLDRSQKDIALLVGVSEYQLRRWERGEEKPSKAQHARWKVKLGECIDGPISDLLGTHDAEVNTRFWQLIWRLTE
jgi:transcriptional regulator with XRE-family HTH domain